MNPLTHFFLSWDVANAGKLDSRDRLLVSVAGIIPDVDAFGMLPELLTRESARPLFWWTDYHHVLGHNLTFAVLMMGAAFLMAHKRLKTAMLTIFTFHLHLLCDVVGARGPDGYHWPIAYLYPFSDSVQLEWAGQWALNAWPNFLITGAALLLAFYWAWQRGYSPIGLFSRSADAVFVATLRQRFGTPQDYV